MKKSQKKGLIILGITLFIWTLIILAYIGNVFSTFIPEDWGIYDSFDTGYDNSKWHMRFQHDAYLTSHDYITQDDGVFVQNGNLYFKQDFSGNVNDVRNTQTSKASLSTKYFYGESFKTTLHRSYTLRNVARNQPCVTGTVRVGAGGCSWNGKELGYKTSIGIETWVSDRDTDFGVLKVNGAEICGFNASQYTTSISIHSGSGNCVGTAWLEESYYKLPFNCKINPATESLYRTTFVGERDVTLADFKVPVKSFCINNPVTITSALHEGVGSDLFSLRDWASAKTVHVPLGQTFEVLYIGDKQYTQGLDCIKGYDVDLKSCIPIIQTVIDCSGDMIYDERIQSCVSTLEFGCERAGGTYDKELGVCEMPMNHEKVCMDMGGIWDGKECKLPKETITKTVIEKDYEGSCEDLGGVYDMVKKECVFSEDVVSSAEPIYKENRFNLTTLLIYLSGLFVVGLFYLIFKKKKK